MQRQSHRAGLLLLEDDGVDGNGDADAEGREHRESHLQLLVLHPVQVVHVLRVEVVRLVVCMRAHSLRAGAVYSSRN